MGGLAKGQARRTPGDRDLCRDGASTGQCSLWPGDPGHSGEGCGHPSGVSQGTLLALLTVRCPESLSRSLLGEALRCWAQEAWPGVLLSALLGWPWLLLS